MRYFLLYALCAFFAVNISAEQVELFEDADVDDGSVMDSDDIDDDDYISELSVIQVPDNVTEEEACMPDPCTRSYEPFCVSVDDAEMTVFSECDFKNRLRCLLVKADKEGKIPIVEYMNDGICIADNKEAN